MANFVSALSPRQLAYRHYLAHSWRWSIVRGVRHLIDGGRCQTCHATERIQCHHASYKHLQMHPGAWLNVWSVWCEVSDTILLCDPCHDGIHRGRSIVEFSD